MMLIPIAIGMKHLQTKQVQQIATPFLFHQLLPKEASC